MPLIVRNQNSRGFSWAGRAVGALQRDGIDAAICIFLSRPQTVRPQIQRQVAGNGPVAIGIVLSMSLPLTVAFVLHGLPKAGNRSAELSIVWTKSPSGACWESVPFTCAKRLTGLSSGELKNLWVSISSNPILIVSPR